jgi:ABC transporter ATM
MLASRLCLRAAARPTLASQSLYLRPLGAATWHTKRIFVTTPRHRKSDIARLPTALQQEQAHGKEEAKESIKPENVEKSKPAQPATKNDPLLAEQTVSNKEQRKADWAIIKNMAHYLWPKDDFSTRFRVGLSVALLVGAKVCITSQYCIERSNVDNIGRSLTFKYPSTSSPSSTA